MHCPVQVYLLVIPLVGDVLPLLCGLVVEMQVVSGEEKVDDLARRAAGIIPICLEVGAITVVGDVLPLHR